ncbi:MAG: hypothetical protein JW750_04600 [Anaerolineaceae bacterium]|nr:hypothetical protein [Anaerolineaceae bacterium]
MDHKPYEQWALMPESCSPQERQELVQHMQSCASCSQLANRWEQVNQLLQSERSLAAPTAGFTERFQHNLEARKAAKHQQQVKKSLLLILAILIMILIVSSIYIYASTPPSYLLKWLFNAGANFCSTIQKFELIGSFFLRQIPIPFFILSLSTMATLLGSLTVVWVTALWKLSTEGATIS